MTLFGPEVEFWLERLFSLMFPGLDFLNQNFSYDFGVYEVNDVIVTRLIILE